MISREQAISVLKRTWRTEELKFYAEFFRPKKDGALIKPRPGVNPFGFFRNLSINDRKIFYPSDEVLQYERNISFKVDVVKGLEDGKYYYLELELEDEENRKENPYTLKIKEVYILEEDHLSPKEFINQWFYKKGHTPGDASTIAGQLTLNELELYTHTKRFIFELIQNADDMPDGSKDVNIEINLLSNHLLFLHNGKYFDREDVKAISDAAKSTKSKSLSQTGYKGIGFKSVFTDSTRVYIKSGDYFFKFDKLEPIYKDFYRLYKGYTDNLTPKAKKEFEIEYKGREQEYTLIEKIPWQIKPIWVEAGTVPQELSTSPFVKNRQVSIALEISENILRQKDYHGMILGLLREPRFLLFLRNTKSFRYSNIAHQNSDSIIDISVKEKNDIIGVYSNEVLIASYIKHAFTISITNEDFSKAGLNFQKREVEGGKIEFFDRNGNKLDNIPEKLGGLDKTIITLSAKMDKYTIEKLDKEDSILFNYLPTSDQRFGFPFLVNADFVSKTDREFIQIENKWNHYLFYHLGQKCIEWIAILANVTHEFQGKKLFSYAKTYLNLLPDELLDEDNEELSSINIAYNKGLTDAIKVSSFIIDNNGNTKKCDEIIIDDTLISRVLGNGFFKEFTKTKKELPFFMLDVDSLKKDYLNIERYEAATLIAEFATEANKLLLTKTLTRLKPEKYFDFLAWLDTICNINDVDNDWLLDLPIIRINESVISLRESFTKSDFYFRVSRTKELEPVLNKIGFTLSELNIDDDNFKHLRAVILQQDSYLKTDLKLYEHIAAAKDLTKLTATEKNNLITFFESLDEVGKAKYAKSLALFKSKKVGGSFKPLNCLISNSCVGLPKWLNDFVIDVEEEKALSTSFQSQLLKEKHLLAKLFCNVATYNELIANITSENLAEFYTYLLKLHEAKPEDTNIDYSKIPWVFIESNSTFALASSVFWPESITKLSAPKYASVKSIIETITDEKLPHQAALQIKAPFALGGKVIKLTEITPKPNLFDVIIVNDFLDWAESYGEKDLLNHFSFSMIDDKFSIGKATGTLTYYTTDESLINLIETSAIKSKLSSFPKELYSKDRNKIGLLEGVSLLKHLLENGLATPALAKYIQGANDTLLSLQYLEMLTELHIESSKSYTIEDAEFKILKLVTSQIIDDSAKLDSFREKITLDSIKLLEKAVSADVRMFDAENKFIYQFQIIELSDILPGYKGKTYPVSEIVERFIDFRDAEGLRKIFKAKGRSTKRIFTELIELKLEVYNASQTFFLSYYQSLYPAEKVLINKIFFSLNSETHKEIFEKELHNFFDYCVKENSYTAFVTQGILASLNPMNLIATEEYAIDIEKFPMWLSEWVNKSESDTKKAYLKLIGINDESSPIVLYRKAIKEAQVEPMSVNCALINNDLLLINTLLWLSVQNTVNGFNIKKEVLQPLYLKLLNRKLSTDKLLIPALQNYQDDSYLLQSMKDGDELHYMNEGWGEYKETIFSVLKSTKRIIDDVLPKAYRDTLKVIEKPFEKIPDNENIVSKSKSFDEEYYQEWALKSQYNIQIYDGTQLPYLIKYNGILINTIKDKYADCIGNVYYVVESKKESILFYLEGILPESALNALKLHKQNLIEKEKEAEKKIQFTEEESAVWKKLFGNDIPEEYYLDYNLAACVSALVVLNNNGYDVSKADSNLFNTHGFAQVEPVYKGDSNEPLTIMCRSAIGGILYLTAQAWDRLGKKEIQLFVKNGKKENSYHLFLDKNDVLKVSDTKYQVFRVEANSSSATTDEILSGQFAKDKIWLILKMKDTDTYKSIFEGGIKRNEENPDIDNINTSENSPY
jgi:hypothetical protein